ncbi:MULTISPECIES: hypothetical protein [Corynebacterium]|uniref:Uncharacterized protein n=1 Tax=Corynebacterium pseudogenitalium TaxID=38303 RepID=A0ABD4TST9_9CORY|nr:MULTISPECIES: hypothetical protein [Corynebacterium]MCQ4614579.1 hypothetical protein [Corynebacterium pseudogenitalium]
MIFRKVGIEVKANNFRRRIIATVLGASLLCGVPIAPTYASAEDASDFKSMLDAHNTKFKVFSVVQGQEAYEYRGLGSSVKSLGLVRTDGSWRFHGCPDDTWRYFGLTNFDANENDGVGTYDRFQKAVEDNRAACDASLQSIVDTATKQQWNRSMEALVADEAALSTAA